MAGTPYRAPALPSPRGPISERLFSALTGPPCVAGVRAGAAGVLALRRPPRWRGRLGVVVVADRAQHVRRVGRRVALRLRIGDREAGDSAARPAVPPAADRAARDSAPASASRPCPPARPARTDAPGQARTMPWRDRRQ